MLNKYRVRLSEKRQLTQDVFLFKFQLLDNLQLDFIAGQYLILSIPQSNGSFLKRIYSIASSPAEKTFFEMVIKIIPLGKATNYLASLTIGDLVDFEGPAGLFTYQNTTGNQTFLATGTGISPILSMLKYSSRQSLATNHQSPVTSHQKLYWGMPKFTDVYLLDELKALLKTLPNFSFKICLSREIDLQNIQEEDKKYFVLGRINSNLEEVIDGQYYICGGPLIVDSLKQHLLQKGIKPENLHFEKF